MKKLLLFCFLFIPLFMNGQVNLTTTTYSQNFNALTTSTTASAWTDNTTIVGVYSQRSGTGTTIVADIGTSTGGNLYSYGSASASDRAIGSIGSGNAAAGGFAHGLRIKNNLGVAIASLSVSYVGEQWRSGGTTSGANTVNFSYQTSTGTALTALSPSTTTVPAGFTAVTSLDFTSPIINSTAGALDGNLTANRVTKTATITFSSPILNGGEILLRWGDPDHSGTDHGLAIDDISITATPVSPTLTATPKTIPAFNYILGNGPSLSSSYSLSGTALTPTADTVKIFAPINFEISKTAGSGFKDTLNVLYSVGSFGSTPIYARLKAGLAENTYSDTIRHSGGGVGAATLPKVKVSGSVTTIPPPVITTSGTLTSFSTFAGAPSASQSYTVSGVNLTDNITITPPAGYEIRTGVGSYATSLVLTQVSGNVETTSIDIRLVGTTAGSFAGNITHTTTGTSAVNVAVTGTVGAFCGTATDVATVRASIPEQGTYAGPAATIAGRVTALFGNNKFYIQDATGGFAVFSNVGDGVVAINGIALGDSVRVTGPKARFNGEIEFNGVTCVNKVTGTLSNVPPAIVFDSNTPPVGINLPTFLSNNEGKLVKVISVNLSNTGTFGSASNYPITACNSQGDGEIRVDVTATTIISQPIPTVSQDITGVVGHYINASATVNIFQLFPRTIADFTGSSVACVTPVPSPSASCGPVTFVSTPVDSTLDVTCWNVEWLGNTTTSPSPLGPTNDAQQMTNVMTVLNTIKSDIFCIEEVCDHKQFTARVKTDLPKYKVRCQTKYYSHFFDSPETTNATTFAQKVCFVYDSTVVTMVDTLSLLVDKYRYDTLNAPPDLPPFQNNWASGRLPFLFIGDVKIGNVIKQIHFVGLHAKSGSAAADYNRRKQDVIDLKVKLDTDYPNANIIMLGDYNDDLDTSIAAGKASSYANFVSDNVNYKQISRALSLCGVSSTASYPDIIDHFMMSNEFGVLAASGPTPSASLSGIYYLDKTINVSRPITYVTNYTSTTSDHYPVNARFTFNLPTEIISVNTGNWSSPSTWNCNCVPSSSSNVTIDTAHTVTVDATSQARSLNVKGTLNWVASFMLSLGQ